MPGSSSTTNTVFRFDIAGPCCTDRTRIGPPPEQTHRQIEATGSALFSINCPVGSLFLIQGIGCRPSSSNCPWGQYPQVGRCGLAWVPSQDAEPLGDRDEFGQR